LPESLTAETTSGFGARFNVLDGGKRFRMSVIEPGPISYTEMKNGTIELLRKPAIDVAIAGLRGKPVTVGHPSGGTNEEISAWGRMNSIGTIEDVTYDPADGWYWAEGRIDKPEAVRANSAPSVVFFPKAMGQGGKYHGIPNGRELLAVDFDHVGLVPSPRFEGASFRFNSSAQPTNTMFNWTRKIIKKVKDAAGIETEQAINETGQLPENATVDLLGDGKQVPLSELVTAHVSRMNAAAQSAELKGDEEITLPNGKTAKVSEIIESERTARLNASGDAAKIAAAAAAKKKADDDAAAEQARLNAAGTPFFVKLASAASVSAGQRFGTPVAANAERRHAEKVQTAFGPRRLEKTT
jgi:hypothetical protein